MQPGARALGTETSHLTLGEDEILHRRHRLLVRVGQLHALAHLAFGGLTHGKRARAPLVPVGAPSVLVGGSELLVQKPLLLGSALGGETFERAEEA